MNNAIMIRVHLDMQSAQRKRLVEELSGSKGVAHANLFYRQNYWLNVVYDTKFITSDIIINQVRQLDENAAIF